MVPDLHVRMNLLVRGYTLESKGEVDILNNTRHNFHPGDEIMMILGYPYLALD